MVARSSANSRGMASMPGSRATMRGSGTGLGAGTGAGAVSLASGSAPMVLSNSLENAEPMAVGASNAAARCSASWVTFCSAAMAGIWSSCACLMRSWSICASITCWLRASDCTRSANSCASDMSGARSTGALTTCVKAAIASSMFGAAPMSAIVAFCGAKPDSLARAATCWSSGKLAMYWSTSERLATVPSGKEIIGSGVLPSCSGSAGGATGGTAGLAGFGAIAALKPPPAPPMAAPATRPDAIDLPMPSVKGFSWA